MALSIQWSNSQLFGLIISFVLFLLGFNYGASMLGSSVAQISFTPIITESSLNISGLSLFNLPILIEAYPPNNKFLALSIWSGNDSLVHDKFFSIATEYPISPFIIRNNLWIRVGPQLEHIGIRLNGKYKLHFLISFIFRIICLFIIGFTIFLLFKAGQHRSEMRSSLILNIGCFCVLSPLQLFIPFINSL